MARRSRIHFDGAVYHVILRGNAGGDVFFQDRDRYRLYFILQHVVEKFRCRIHGFCFMTNHFHLVMQVGEVPLSRIMQNLSLRYTKWINFSRPRTGHVFQGRYKAIVVDADSYLLELVRYVHLNPVRAGLAKTPESWPWCGHGAYTGSDSIPWLTTDLVLSMFSSDESEARKAYLCFVREGMEEGRRGEFHVGTCEGRLLGDDEFVDAALEKNAEKTFHKTIADVIDAVCQVYQCTLQQLHAPGKARPFSEARAVASLVTLELQHLPLTDLGKVLNRDAAVLGRAGRRLKSEAADKAQLRELLEKVKRQMAE